MRCRAAAQRPSLHPPARPAPRSPRLFLSAAAAFALIYISTQLQSRAPSPAREEGQDRDGEITRGGGEGHPPAGRAAFLGGGWCLHPSSAPSVRPGTPPTPLWGSRGGPSAASPPNPSAPTARGWGPQPAGNTHSSARCRAPTTGKDFWRFPSSALNFHLSQGWEPRPVPSSAAGARALLPCLSFLFQSPLSTIPCRGEGGCDWIGLERAAMGIAGGGNAGGTGKGQGRAGSGEGTQWEQRGTNTGSTRCAPGGCGSPGQAGAGQSPALGGTGRARTEQTPPIPAGTEVPQLLRARGRTGSPPTPPVARQELLGERGMKGNCRAGQRLRCSQGDRLRHQRSPGARGDPRCPQPPLSPGRPGGSEPPGSGQGGAGPGTLQPRQRRGEPRSPPCALAALSAFRAGPVHLALNINAPAVPSGCSRAHVPLNLLDMRCGCTGGSQCRPPPTLFSPGAVAGARQGRAWLCGVGGSATTHRLPRCA